MQIMLNPQITKEIAPNYQTISFESKLLEDSPNLRNPFFFLCDGKTHNKITKVLATSY